MYTEKIYCGKLSTSSSDLSEMRSKICSCKISDELEEIFNSSVVTIIRAPSFWRVFLIKGRNKDQAFNLDTNDSLL